MVFSISLLAKSIHKFRVCVLRTIYIPNSKSGRKKIPKYAKNIWQYLTLHKILYGEINTQYPSRRNDKFHLTTAASQKTWRIAGRQKPIIVRSLRSVPIEGKLALLVNTVRVSKKLRKLRRWKLVLYIFSISASYC